MRIYSVDMYSLKLFEFKSCNNFIQTIIKHNIINRHLYDSEIE